MKEVEKYQLDFISGGQSLNTVLCLGALYALVVGAGIYFAKNTKAATKEEEEYYFLTQNMKAFNQPLHAYNDFFGV